MKANDLAQMSLKELRALRDKLEDLIATREVEEREDVKAKAFEMAARAGFSIGELFGFRRTKRSGADVQYRNPENPSQTWSGRGRRPFWIIKAGGDYKRFRV